MTGALAIGMHQMAKRNALVRKMPAVETLGCATVICSDKTGTLTKGEMTVRKIYVAGRDHDVTGVGYEPVGEILGEERKIEFESPLGRLLKAALLCNDAQLQEVEGRWKIKGDPTEGALVVAAPRLPMSYDESAYAYQGWVWFGTGGLPYDFRMENKPPVIFLLWGLA